MLVHFVDLDCIPDNHGTRIHTAIYKQNLRSGRGVSGGRGADRQTETFGCKEVSR